MQERRNSNALVMGLLLSCTKPSKCNHLCLMAWWCRFDPDMYWSGSFLFDSFEAWSPSQYKDHFSGYRDFNYKDKMVMRLLYLYNENPCTSKMASLYWNRPFQYIDHLSRCMDVHFKDEHCEGVLSLWWEFLCWWDGIFILKWPCDAAYIHKCTGFR